MRVEVGELGIFLGLKFENLMVLLLTGEKSVDDSMRMLRVIVENGRPQ